MTWQEEAPSSGAARHLLPQGEKEGKVGDVDANALPSPLVGEGARRAGEGVQSVPKDKLKDFARDMRKAPIHAEARMWRLLRGRSFVNYKFRRQVPIDRYIADFVCYAAKLIVELDGSQHAESARDVQRDAVLTDHGFRVLRIWNNDLSNDVESVSQAIWHALQDTEDAQ